MQMVKDSPALEWDTNKHKRHKLRLACLEADVAYFRARLEILGEPETANQHAQHRAYKLLRESLGDLALKTKRRLADGDLNLL